MNHCRRRAFLEAALGALAFFAAATFLSADDPLILQRLRMVSEQIERRGIRNPDVLRVMRSTPRHLFVPAANEAASALIGHGSEPLAVFSRSSVVWRAKSSRALASCGCVCAIISKSSADLVFAERHIRQMRWLTIFQSSWTVARNRGLRAAVVSATVSASPSPISSKATQASRLHNFCGAI